MQGALAQSELLFWTWLNESGHSVVTNFVGKLQQNLHWEAMWPGRYRTWRRGWWTRKDFFLPKAKTLTKLSVFLAQIKKRDRRIVKLLGDRPEFICWRLGDMSCACQGQAAWRELIKKSWWGHCPGWTLLRKFWCAAGTVLLWRRLAWTKSLGPRLGL